MKLVFFITVICLTCLASAQSPTLYSLVDVKKSKQIECFGLTIVELSNHANEKLYSFNKRISFPSMTKLRGNIFLLLPDSNFLFKYSLSEKKMSKKRVANSNYHNLSFLKCSKDFDNFVYFQLYNSSGLDVINSHNDTMYIYRYNISKDKIYLTGSYIKGIHKKKSSDVSGHVIFMERNRDKNGLIGEFIRMIDLDSSKAITIDTLFSGYDESTNRLHKSFSQNNVQFINDSIIYYTYFKFESKSSNGLNFFCSYNLKNSQKRVIFSVNESIPIEGFVYDVSSDLVYISNEKEIYSFDVAKSTKTTLYKKNTLEVDNIKSIVR